MKIFGLAARLSVHSNNVLLGSERCPHIASTIDGWVGGLQDSVVTLADLGPSLADLCSDPQHAEEFLESLPRNEDGYIKDGIIEMKQSDGWKKQVEQWTEGVPEYYWIQVQTQLYVTGVDYAAVVCRLGVADIRCHVVLPDEDFWNHEMIPAVEEFWNEV